MSAHANAVAVVLLQQLVLVAVVAGPSTARAWAQQPPAGDGSVEAAETAVEGEGPLQIQGADSGPKIEPASESAGETDAGSAAAPRPAEPAAVAAKPATQDPAELLAFANLAYDEGRHGEARDLYQRLVELGYGGAAVHYNLGNAHLRSGDQGRAIASYLRAQGLAPRDQDVQANLTFARGTTTDDLEPPLTPPLLRTLFFWYFGMSRAELVRALVVVDVLFFAALSLWLFRRRSEAMRWVAGGLLALLVVLSASTALRWLRPQRTAVVVAPELEAYTGTSADSSVRFRLHAGTEARAVDQRDGWVRVRLPNGEQGWVAQEQVEVVAR